MARVNNSESSFGHACNNRLGKFARSFCSGENSDDLVPVLTGVFFFFPNGIPNSTTSIVYCSTVLLILRMNPRNACSEKVAGAKVATKSTTLILVRGTDVDDNDSLGRFSLFGRRIQTRQVRDTRDWQVFGPIRITNIPNKRNETKRNKHS
jgi:hypothetical protein